jgi:hypothetical protein
MHDGILFNADRQSAIYARRSTLHKQHCSMLDFGVSHACLRECRTSRDMRSASELQSLDGMCFAVAPSCFSYQLR